MLSPLATSPERETIAQSVWGNGPPWSVRLQASGTHQFGQEPSARPLGAKADPAIPPLTPAFTPTFSCVLPLTGYPLQCAASARTQPPVPGGPRSEWVVLSHPLIAWRPHPPVWTAPPHFPAPPVIDAVFGIQASSCLPPRPSGPSPLYFPGLPPSASAGRPALKGAGLILSTPRMLEPVNSGVQRGAGGTRRTHRCHFTDIVSYRRIRFPVSC